MRKLNKFVALCLAATMVVGSVSGCASKEEQKNPANDTTTETTDNSDSKDAASGDTAATTTATAGGEINVHVGPEPNSIDPQINQAVDGGILIIHGFEGLMKYSESGEYVEGQAESYTVSDDGLVYTFTIRDDAKWSDGQTVTAEDFVYTWQRLVDPATASNYNYMLNMVVNAEDITQGNMQPSELGVKALDEKTLEVTLNAPCAYFLEVCAFPSTYPVRKDIIEEFGDSWATSPEHYVGNGAYVLSNWDHQSKMTYVKNENYYDYTNLGPDTINFTLIEDWNAVLSAFKNGDILFGDELPSEEIPAMQGNGLQIIPQLGVYFLCLNVEKEELKDVNVRKALSLAIDRKYIAETVKQDGSIPADTYVPEGLKDADGGMFREKAEKWWDNETYDANVEEAKQLLADAGYPNGEGFPQIEIMINPGHESIAEAVQNMWQEKLGITATIASNDWNVFIETRDNGEYTVARHGWVADYNDPITFLDMWVTGGGNNDANYSNPEYDQLIKDVMASNDNEERFAKMHEAESILAQDMPVIPLYYYADTYLLSDSLQGMYLNSLGFKYFMYCKTAQ